MDSYSCTRWNVKILEPVYTECFRTSSDERGSVNQTLVKYSVLRVSWTD